MADSDNSDKSSRPKYDNKNSDKPPILDEDGVTFVNWRIKTDLWCDNTNISSKHKAGKILVKLPDRAFEHVKDID